MSNKLALQQFGLGLMAALITKGRKEIYVYSEANFHESFRKAYEVVEQELGEDGLDHWTIITGGIRGLSGAVESILDYWGMTWASYGGGYWRFKMTNREIEKLLSDLPGGRDVYLRAADAFLDQYQKN